MNPSTKYGRAMMRGSEQFEVETESAFFTTLLENDAVESKINTLISPRSIRKIGRRLLRIEVNRADRDAAMAKLRSEDGKIVCHHAYRLPGKKKAHTTI
ncbi:MAG: hypothetical protein AB1Z20_23890 [Desulfobacterales bacterium]